MICSRYTALLCALALGAKLASGRSLQQAALTSVPTNASFGNTLMTYLNGNASAVGPIVYKTFDAAYYALTAEVNVFSGIPASFPNQVVALGNGSQVVVAANPTSKIVMLGFSASNATLALMLQTVTTLEPVAFLNTMFQGGPPAVNPAVLDPFLAAAPQITTAIATLLGGNGIPERVVCSGHAGGGAWAQLCGVWSQVTYPSANTRAISFGAPLVGDEKWVYTFDQFVDLGYVWVTASDQIPTGPSGGLVQVNLTRTINDNSTVAGKTELPNSLGYYCETLLNVLQADPSNIPVVFSANFSYSFLPSEAVSTYAPAAGSSTTFYGSITSAVGNIRDSLSAIGSTISSEVGSLFGGGSSAPAPAPTNLGVLGSAAPTPGGPPGGGTPQSTGSATAPSVGTGHGPCDPFLCKIQPAIVDSCNVYNAGNGNIGPGSINIGPSPKTGTDVAVAYNATSNVASIVFRGSSSTQDWIQDFKLWLTETPTTSYFQQLYPGTVIHEGFLQQFQEVVSNTNNSLSFPYQLSQLMGANTVPVRVNVTGHSLGAGVASICAVWAALQFPTADVRLITFGSPKVGNRDWAMSALATVGRSYRNVNQADEVPALPPITDYLAIETGLHITNGTIVLGDRAAIAFDDLTWDDHGCDDHYLIGIQTASNITLPSYILALPPASTVAGDVAG